MSADPVPSPRADLAVVRSSCRTARRSLGGRERALAQEQIAGGLLGLDELRGPGRIALFLPTDGEVDLGGIHDQLLARRWELFLPVIGADTSMRFRPFRPGDPMVPNRHGIDEPQGDARSDRRADDLGVVVVPCVAVDRSRRRAGFGAGYYDRALADHMARTVTIGVAFECQLVDELPHRPWDVPMDVVVTEARVLRPEA